jgi:hypothetical protein
MRRRRNNPPCPACRDKLQPCSHRIRIRSFFVLYLLPRQVLSVSLSTLRRALARLGEARVMYTGIISFLGGLPCDGNGIWMSRYISFLHAGKSSIASVFIPTSCTTSPHHWTAARCTQVIHVAHLSTLVRTRWSSGTDCSSKAVNVSMMSMKVISYACVLTPRDLAVGTLWILFCQVSNTHVKVYGSRPIIGIDRYARPG